MEDIVPKTLTKNKILKHLNTLYMKTAKFYLNINICTNILFPRENCG